MPRLIYLFLKSTQYVERKAHPNLLLFFRSLKAFIWDSSRLEYEAARSKKIKIYFVVAASTVKSQKIICPRKVDPWSGPASKCI